MALEVPRADWVASLERFSREHRAWLALVERAGEHPLRAVELETPGRLAIRFADASPDVIVAEPHALRIDESGLDIESAQGVTRLRFRVTAAPEALDGLAPSERWFSRRLQLGNGIRRRSYSPWRRSRAIGARAALRRSPVGLRRSPASCRQPT
jgi:hypothetical protein